MAKVFENNAITAYFSRIIPKTGCDFLPNNGLFSGKITSMLNFVFSTLSSPFAKPLSLRLKENGYAVLPLEEKGVEGCLGCVFFVESEKDIKRLSKTVDFLIEEGEPIPLFCVSYNLLDKGMINEIATLLKGYPDPTFYFAFPYVFGHRLPLSSNPVFDRLFSDFGKHGETASQGEEEYEVTILSDALDQVESSIHSQLELPLEGDDWPIPPTISYKLSRNELSSFLSATKANLGDLSSYLFSLSSPIKRALFADVLPYFSSLPLKERETEFGYLKELYKDNAIGEFDLLRFEGVGKMKWMKGQDGERKVVLLKGAISVETVENGKLHSTVLSSPLTMKVEVKAGVSWRVVSHKPHSMAIVHSSLGGSLCREVPLGEIQEKELYLSLDSGKERENPYEELDKAKRSYRQHDPWGKKRNK